MPSIEEVIGHRFKDARLIREALTHKSHAYESGAGTHNERLEFLGDSVLSAIVAHLLFQEHPDEDEGRLSKRKALLVSRATLAQWGQQLGLGRFVRLGSGEESTGGRTRLSILANTVEALIGAVYMDAGFETASAFVHRCFLDKREDFVETDFKSRLQEIVQKRHKVPPEYRLLDTSGPDHEKHFTVEVRLGARKLGMGDGKSKKEAEQAAASDALGHLSKSKKYQ